MVQNKFGKGALFGDEEQRILARCDTFPDNQTYLGKKQTTPFLHKSLASIFPNLDQFAVILDDRDDIWSTSVENVVRIFPYHFFAFGDINDPAKIANERENKKKRKRISGSTHENLNNKVAKMENMSEFTKTKEKDEGDGEKGIKGGNEDSSEPLQLDQSFADVKETNLVDMNEVIPDNTNLLESDQPLGWNSFLNVNNENGGFKDNDNGGFSDEINDDDIGFGFGGRSNVSLFGQTDESDKFMDNDFNFGEIQNDKEDIKDVNTEEVDWNNNDVNSMKEEKETNWGDKGVDNGEENDEENDEEKELDVEIIEPEPPQIILDGTESILKADDDDHLSSILDVLKDIHFDYFKALKSVVAEDFSTVNVKDIIAKRRKRTLKGCSLVMFEVSKKDLIMSTSFGATLYRDLNDNVTHIITNNPDIPAIINRKAEDRVYVVNPTWLWDSVFKWEKQDELKYPVIGVEVLIGEPPLIDNELGKGDDGSENSDVDKDGESMEYSEEEESNQSDDDGLMDDLEKELQQLKEEESSSESAEEDEGEQLRNRFFALDQIEEEDFS